MAERDYTPYQQGIIRRYYQNYDAIQAQRLSDLAAEIYLAGPKKQDRLWKQVAEILTRLEFPPGRIAHLLDRKDPSLLPGVLQELEQGK